MDDEVGSKSKDQTTTRATHTSEERDLESSMLASSSTGATAELANASNAICVHTSSIQEQYISFAIGKEST